LPYPLLPVYIQVTPVNGQSPDIALGMTTQQLASLKTPIPSQPVLDLSEGPHLGYAIQWFSFAVILGLGYPFYIRREEKRRNVGLLLNEQGNGI
jgi:surfeit locus 1 family protein